MDWESLFDQLSNESHDMRELDDRKFLELKAVLSVPSYMDLRLAQRDRQAFSKQQEDLKWLKRLLAFNELVRNQRAESVAPVQLQTAPDQLAPPKSVEEATARGFVKCTAVLAALRDHFDNHASLTRYLDQHEHIRIFKPSSNRKMVHAGDLIRQLASESDRDFEGLEKGVQERMQQMKEERSQPRK